MANKSQREISLTKREGRRKGSRKQWLRNSPGNVRKMWVLLILDLTGGRDEFSWQSPGKKEKGRCVLRSRFPGKWEFKWRTKKSRQEGCNAELQAVFDDRFRK